MINKNTQNTNLSWNPIWVNHQYFLLLQNSYLQMVFSYYYRQGWYYTLFTSNYWKEETTPYFIIYNWQDATTPYLPATTGRRLQPPTALMPSLDPPYHPLFSYDIQIWFTISVSDSTLVSNFYNCIELYLWDNLSHSSFYL